MQVSYIKYDNIEDCGLWISDLKIRNDHNSNILGLTFHWYNGNLEQSF
jgi:hypothetical protein